MQVHSVADGGVVDRVCAPLDDRPGLAYQDGLNRHWSWDFTRDPASGTLGLVPRKIADMPMLGELFDPTQFGARREQRFTPRNRGSQH